MSKFLFDTNSGNCDSVYLDRDWLDAHQSLNCPPASEGGCGGILESRQLDVIAESPVNVPFTGTTHLWLGVIREDLFDLISAEKIMQGFHIGSVQFSKKSRTKTNFFSCSPRFPLLRPRGGDRSFFRFCNLCGNSSYHPMIDTDYFLKTDLGDECVRASETASMVVTPDIATTILSQNFKNVYIDRVPVQDVPVDGLPLDLNLVPRDYVRDHRGENFPLDMTP